MRRLVSILVVALVAAAAFGQYVPSLVGGPAARGGRGSGAGVTLRVDLPASRQAPVIVAQVDVGFPSTIAVHVSVTPAHPWRNTYPMQLVYEDSTESAVDEHHVAVAPPSWEVYEGDVVELVCNVYNEDLVLVHSEPKTVTLDGPGLLKAWAWCGNEITDAAPDSGWTYALADTHKYDRVLKDNTGKTKVRYTAPMRAHPDSVDQWYRGLRPTGKIEDDGVWPTWPNDLVWMPRIWFNLEEIPYYAKIVRARLVFSIMEYGDANLTGGYFAARFCTLATDLGWLTNPGFVRNPTAASDSLFARCTWNFMIPSTQTPWDPPLDQRDDWHDYGPISSTTFDGTRAVVNPGDPTHALQIDVTDAVQQYCDRGPDRVNAGFVLYGMFNNWSNGFIEISAGPALSGVRGSPQLVVEWVDGVYNVPAWGTGGVPMVITIDDGDTDHLTMGEAITAAGGTWSEVVSENNVGGAGKLSAAQFDSLRNAGVDVVLHTHDHIVMGNLETPAEFYGQLRRDWLDEVWTSSTPNDTGHVEWKDFAYPAGGGLAYTVTGIQQLQKHGYRSGRGYGSATDDSVGIVTHIAWDRPSNVFAIAATSSTPLKGDTYAATYEKVMTVVDTYYNADRQAVVLMQHYLDGPLDHFTAAQWDYFCQVLGDIDCAPMITFEQLITQRYAASTFVTPEVGFAGTMYLTGDPWADRVWLGACRDRETGVAP